MSQSENNHPCGSSPHLAESRGVIPHGLGYGTTALVALSSQSERLRLLETAFDAGITHFDTAPYYGYGEAERVLGVFLKGRRDRVTITTKFGIEPPAAVRNPFINKMARSILGLVPSLRVTLSKKAQGMSRRGAFSVESARKSLERSLSSLQTDRIDLFLLHEPSLSDAASPEILEFLEGEVRRGRIRSFGCGGDYSVMERIRELKLPTSACLQFEDDIFSRNVDAISDSCTNCITFRAIQKGLPILREGLVSHPDMRGRWEGVLSIDVSREENMASLLIGDALLRNARGTVLFSSSRTERIVAAVEAARGLNDPLRIRQIQQFQELVDSDFGAGKKTGIV